jgi:hypothetical protein
MTDSGREKTIAALMSNQTFFVPRREVTSPYSSTG